MRIDCRECVMQHTEHCDDCVVTHILDREDGPVVVDHREAVALRSLGAAGLVPLLRLTPKPPASDQGPTEASDRAAG